MKISDFRVKEGEKFKLSDIKTDFTGDIDNKEQAEVPTRENIEKLAGLQDKLYAQGKYGILINIQAMDTAGKDGVIKHVMTGLNPQGTQVHSFKEPSVEELNHDYLWRAVNHLPGRGYIGIFNRSYYEEVLVVRVHNLIQNEKIPSELINEDIWKKRYRQINDFEEYLNENGFIVIKIFLHISKEEQRQRLLSRIDDKTKNWKFSAADIKEREFWNHYQKCYQELFRETSTKNAPWYVIPSDSKWFSRYVFSEILLKSMENLDLEYPNLNSEQQMQLQIYKQHLLDEE
ncbi:MAG: polyphosphate kinase 2 family protein [Bacteroidota bacterium]|nr:polyphosphate kinase 2 family protein [Bacteroidota bacterium]